MHTFPEESQTSELIAVDFSGGFDPAFVAWPIFADPEDCAMGSVPEVVGACDTTDGEAAGAALLTLRVPLAMHTFPEESQMSALVAADFSAG
jgi:hypothetical protein